MGADARLACSASSFPDSIRSRVASSLSAPFRGTANPPPLHPPLASAWPASLIIRALRICANVVRNSLLLKIWREFWAEIIMHLQRPHCEPTPPEPYYS